ncbi:RNA-processing protein, HAT helix [Corchorus capsularis]|uniref:RNA-processing protein, HAT helix n=1 Tax=Corchorus capsularis TaxID=210143 RepID=A0A1R3GRP0_COCAP|nr:RNA-processing protein, HAT helix [Corchorus capsularis]
MIEKGCQNWPKNQDIWLEALQAGMSRRGKRDPRAMKAMPNASKLWLQAVMLERDAGVKNRVLRRGIENIPNSVMLWRALIEMVDEENIELAVLLLNKAVECCPTHVDFWLALARLLPFDQAREALERVRHQLLREPAIRITRARLEEAGDDTDCNRIGNIIHGFIRELERECLHIDRRAWMEVAERLGSAVTYQAIIKNTIGIGMGREVEVTTRKILG